MMTTKKPRKPLTLQQIFTLAWRGLRKQRWIQSSRKGICQYRGPSGRKCAIGHCLSRAELSHGDGSVFEGAVGSSLPVAAKVRLGLAAEFGYSGEGFCSAGPTGHSANDLINLQVCHDQATSGKDMRERLRAFAKLHNLKVPR